MKRRNFFKTSIIAGGGLMISTYLPFSCKEPKIEGESWEPNFFLRIDPDNSLTFICSRTELGQGTSTGLAMIVADELDVELSTLKSEFADGALERYGDLQDTGGSNGIRLLWKPLRTAMAATREIFVLAAAKSWKVDASDCYTTNGVVYTVDNSRSSTYASLIPIAKEIPVPWELKYRNASDYKYIGKSVVGKRVDEIVRGKYQFSINVKLPGMVYAVIERCPVWEGKLIEFDAERAKKFPGVIDVIEVPGTAIPSSDFKGGVRPGVAVLATNTWAAMEGKKLLDIEWDLGRFANKSDTDVREELLGQIGHELTIRKNFKQGHEQLNSTNKKIAATYISPYQAHVCMEPLNATAYHKGNSIEIWAGSQGPAMFRERIHELTGIPEASIISHNLPSGGGFGRRFHSDYVEEAVLISEKLRKPVKVTWTREDTITTSKYHPYCVDHWEAAIDNSNNTLAIGYQGTVGSTNGYRPYPYDLPMAHYNHVFEKEGRMLPRASWRSVYAHPWHLSLECFIDELASIAQKDPIEYRLERLQNAAIVEQIMEVWVGDNLYPEKLIATLEKVKELSNWGNVDENHFQGVSSISYNTSYCSQVIEISKAVDKLKVEKVTVVLNCGTVINPSQVIAQVEGSVIWGLTAAIKSKLSITKGHIQQKNYDSYAPLRMQEVPEIHIHLIKSNDPPSGAGEPAVPGVAPALLNAVFAATNERIREIPVSRLFELN